MFDVEMVGKTGHSCHVFIMSDDAHRVAKLAEQYFPELELTGNTEPVREHPASDRQDCLTPAGMEQARQAARASVPNLSPLDDHQTGCVCRECSAHQREEETFATNRQNRIRYGE